MSDLKLDWEGPVEPREMSLKMRQMKVHFLRSSGRQHEYQFALLVLCPVCDTDSK